MARNKKVEILSNSQEVLHPMTDGDCVIFEDGQTLTQKLSEDDSVKYTPEIVNSSPMFKVGEGNTVDYSDNVLDGAYERATLQGQTYVNYIQESSADEVTLPTPFTEYERTQHNTLTSNEEGVLGINLVGQSYVNALQHDSEEEYVVLGENLEFQEKKVEYTNEGQIKSAMLKGQTLVNLAKTRFGTSGSNVNLTRTEVENGMTYTVPNQATGYITIRTDAHELLKPSTTYTILFEIVENTIQDYNGVTVCGAPDSYFSRNENQLYHNSAFDLSVGKKRLVVTTHNNISTYDGFGFGFPDFPRSGKEDAGVFTIKNVMVIEGDHSNEDIPYFEGMQSVTVSTRLENLCHKYNDGLAKNGKTFNTNSLSDRCIKLVDYKEGAEATYGMKPNTKYLVQFKISNLVLDGLSSLGLVFSVGDSGTTNYLFKDASKVGLITANGIYRVVLTTTDLVSTSGVEIKGIADEWENSGSSLRSMTISEIMYVEYQNGMENWDLPYFEDYQVMKPVQVESVNKNLLNPSYFVDNMDINATSGNIYSSDTTMMYNEFIEVNTSKQYILKRNLENHHVSIRFYDSNKRYLGYQQNIDATTGAIRFTGFENTKYVRFRFIKSDNSFEEIINVTQFEESSTATSYVPHQSKTTYSWDEVILRKIGDVEDTLDLTTGEWVQRIGEIVLDGSDDETWQRSTASDNKTVTSHFYYILSAEDNREQVQVICDNFVYNNAIFTDLETEGIKLQYGDAGELLWLNINKDKLNSDDSSGIRQYLSQNPITVQYILNTPIVHKVNLSRPNLQVYDDITHVHTKCLDGTLVPNIYLPSDISYPAILEPGKKYNVCVNQTEVSADNPLKVNVGGTEITMTDSRMTLTTPATLANSNVSFTGKGNKIKESMLIKNSSLLTRDLPHFNGIGSVQLGKTIENLCSASSFKAGNSDSTITWYDNHAHIKISNKAGSCVFAYELVKLLENGKKYFIYSPQTLDNSSCRVSFRRVYNNSLSYARQQTVLPKNGKCIIEIDQTDNPYTHICVGCHHDIPLNTEFDVYRPIICEYELGMENWDWESIGYFTGTKNIGNEFMKVQNKNLFDLNKDYFVQGSRLVENNLQVSDASHRITSKDMKSFRCKPDTSYTITFSDNNYDLGIYVIDDNGNLLQNLGWFSQNDNKTFITDEKAKYFVFHCRKTDNSNITVNDYNYSSIQLEESSTATTYTAHKHNGLYITKDQPINLTWEQGAIFYESGVSWSQMTNNVNSMRIRTPQPLTLEPNKTYRISLGSDKYQYGIQLYNGSNNGVFDYGWNTDREFIFTTTKDKYKVGIAIGKIDSSNNTPITPSESVHAQVRLEEVTDVVLRSCSGKYDELDLTRGTYIQNVGRVYLDGINALSRLITPVGDSYQPTDTTLKTFDIRCDGAVVDGICLSNRFPMRESMASANINFESVRIHSTAASCRLTIKKEKTSTVEELKLWLQDNPLEIIYALKTPIVHKVHIGNKNETNTEVAKPNGVFTLPTLYTEQTHIDLTNNGIVPKVQSRDYIAYPVLPMISRTYTLQHNLTGGVSNLTVDLLGRTQSVSYQNHKSLVYSPETMDAILHNELRISGKGKISRVMYIDGGYMDRDIPYIEGMKNAVNPIVKNVGKNLVQKIDDIWYFYENTINHGEVKHNCGIAPVKPYTQYIINKNSILCFYDENGKCTNSPFQYFNANIPRTAPSGSKYMLVRHNGGDNATYLDGLQVVEYGQEFDNQEHKENICYVDCGEIRLTPDMFEQGSVGAANVGSHYNSDKADSSYRIRTKELIKLEIGEQYVFLGNNDKYKYSARFYDMNGNKVSHSTTYDLSWKGTTPFTILNDAPMCAFFIKKANDSAITVADIEEFNFQLVKVSEIKQLRSLPHGVQDEIDLETGKYIQRVGEITFNGTENWLAGYPSWDNKRTYYNNTFADIKLMKGSNGSGDAYYDAVRCPQLHRSYMGRLASASIDGVCSYYYSGYQRIFISKQDCATVNELKLWLQENPITVQYELPEPIVKDIVIHNYPHSYEGGHVIIENGDPSTPIPAQLTYRAVTNRSGQIQQHTEQVEKQEREINELETLILANINLSQTR